MQELILGISHRNLIGACFIGLATLACLIADEGKEQNIDITECTEDKAPLITDRVRQIALKWRKILPRLSWCTTDPKPWSKRS